MKRMLLLGLLVSTTLAFAQTPNDIDNAISSNQLAEATQMVQALRPKYPDNPVLSYLESRLLLRKGDYQGAREALNRAKSRSDLGFVDAAALAEHERAIVAGLQPASIPMPVSAQPAVTSVVTPVVSTLSPNPVQLQPVPAPVSAVPKSMASSGLGNPINVADKSAFKILGLEPFDWVMALALLGFPLLMFMMNRKKNAKAPPPVVSGLTTTAEASKPGFFERLRAAKPTKLEPALDTPKSSDFSMDQSPKS